MLTVGNLKRFLIVIICLFCAIVEIEAIFKLTNVECLSKDKLFADFEYCRLKAVRRNVAEFSFKIHLLQEPVNSIMVHVQLLRKYSGYRPFLINYTWDACAFMRNRNVPIISVFYNVFKDFSNVNHTCPYEGEVILEKLHLLHENLKLPLPSGEYRINMNWSLNNKLRIHLYVWFLFEELENVRPRTTIQSDKKIGELK